MSVREIRGNETAYELARLASSTSLFGPEPGIPVPLSTLYSFIRLKPSKMVETRFGKQDQKTSKEFPNHLPEIL